MATNSINNFIDQLLAENDARLPDRSSSGRSPEEQAAHARHPGSIEDSVQKMSNHAANLMDAMTAYRADKTAAHIVHGNHADLNAIHEHVKTTLEEVDSSLGLPYSETAPYRTQRYRDDDPPNTDTEYSDI
jgi:hypothetical protein